MAALSAAFVEREYNLRQAFPDHPQWLARWASDSANARAHTSARLDVRYGPGRQQTLDIFAADDARTTLLFVHGGYWRALDKSDHSFIAPTFVARGLGVVVINYDLCPDVGIAQIIEQCRQAVMWLVREGARHGLATGRVCVAGHSAGGHLVAMLFATDWSAYGIAPDVIVAGLAISGVFDLEPLIQVSFNTELRLDAQNARALSPANMLPRVRAPMLLAAGANETGEFVRQSWLQWERWPGNRPTGARGPLLVADRHHFSILSDLADADSALAAAAMDLIENA